MRVSALFAGLPLLFAVSACGARGPIGLEVVDVTVTPDASAAGAANTLVDGGGAGSSSGGSSGSSSGSSSGGGPGSGIIGALIDAGGPIGCGACFISDCGTQIGTCVADPACATALQCIATTCLAGGDAGAGGAGLGCFTNCAGGALLELVPIVTCLTGTCGGSCGSVLGGLGGGIPGLGGSSSGG
jgi:hypothetical protein